MDKNLYEIIGLDMHASQSEIDEKCINLAKQYLPHSQSGGSESELKFKEIEGAYEILGDSSKRADYDAKLNSKLINTLSSAPKKPHLINTNCPICNSANIQRFSVIHSSGITNVDLVSKGGSVGIGAGHALGGGSVLGVGVSRNKSKIKGTHQTELSKQVAPPSKFIKPSSEKAFKPSLIIAGILFIALLFTDIEFSYVFFGALLVWLIIFAILNELLLTQEEIDKAFSEHEAEVLKWQNSFMCLSCGHQYQIA